MLRRISPVSAALPSCFDHAVRSWLIDLCCDKQLSPHTLRAYGYHTRDCLRAIVYAALLCDKERLTMDTIGDADIYLFRYWTAMMHRRKVSAQSAATALRCAKGFFRHLMRTGVIADSAIFSLKRPKTPHLLPKPAERRDILRMLTQWPSAFPHDRPDIIARDTALMMFLYGTGCRVFEALSLNMDDIQPDTRRLSVCGKGGKTRVIPLIIPVRESILSYARIASHAAMPDRPLFLGLQGQRLRPEVVARRFRIARRRLGLPAHITAHTFRHSFATHLCDEGGCIRVIQTLLGHSNINTTLIYTKINNPVLYDAVTRCHPRARLAE